MTDIQQPQTIDPTLTASARVETPNALRYMKALCNHFGRKVQAEYSDTRGIVHFPFGVCRLEAADNTLALHVEAADAEALQRAQGVIDSHLLRFAPQEELQIVWEGA